MTARLISPPVGFEPIGLEEMNDRLVAWGHKMGPLNRAIGSGPHYGLFHESRCVGVVASATSVRETIAGLGLPREAAIELARLCCERRDLCRVVLRLWREFVFPMLGRPWAISYSDSALHSGDLYRFDGWVRLGVSRSGTDQRTGRKGRNKVVWGWCPDPEAMAERRAA